MFVFKKERPPRMEEAFKDELLPESFNPALRLACSKLQSLPTIAATPLPPAAPLVGVADYPPLICFFCSALMFKFVIISFEREDILLCLAALLLVVFAPTT